MFFSHTTPQPATVTALRWLLTLMLLASSLLASLGFSDKALATTPAHSGVFSEEALAQQNTNDPQTIAAPGEITGNVKASDTNQPISGGVRVNVRNASNAFIASELADNTGNYRIASLQPGTYKLHFQPVTVGSLYIDEYYNKQYNIGAATLVTVNDSQVTANIDALLDRGGVISGTVTAEGSGQPLPGVKVVAESEDHLKFTVTDQNGRYQLSPLIADTYTVDFSTQGVASLPYFDEYYNNKQNDLVADKIVVTSGSTFTNIDAALTPIGTIKGRVTAADSNAGIAEGKVRAFGSGNPINAVTDASGYYTLTPLLPYSYTIQFVATTAANSTNYLGEYYNDKPSALTADKVVVTISVPTVENVNAVLAPSVSISGKVIAADSKLPLSFVQVVAYGVNCQPQVVARTDASGVYTLTGLADGGYRIYFDALTFLSPLGYLSEYYDNKATLLTATIVTATAPTKLENINAELEPGAKVTGQVKGENGQPIGNVSVNIVGVNSGISAITDDGGYYTSTALASGDYLVSFVPVGQAYMRQYYNGKLTAIGAQTVTLQAPQALGNINATLQLGAQFSGTVTYANATPVNNGRVTVYDATSGLEVASASTNVAGRYVTSPGVPTGNYILRFRPNSAGSATYAYTYHNQKGTLPSADPVAVTAPNATVIDAVLQPGGGISGSIAFSNTGQNFPGDLLVEVYDSAGQLVDSVDYNPATGQYSTAALPTGSYRLFFRPFDVTENCVDLVDYARVYYKNQLTLATATQVNVTAPTATSGINQAIYLFGQVPQQPIALSAVTITGPTVGAANAQHSFTAKITPADATSSFTYTWQATGQTNVVNISQDSNNTANFNWISAGTKTVTVTVTNGFSSVSQSFVIEVTPAPGRKVYLPSVYK